MPRTSSKPRKDSAAYLGVEAKVWLAADKFRSNMVGAQYNHVVLGLIFLKYISDTCEECRAKLVAGKGFAAGANPEDQNESKAENVFWVHADARWTPSRDCGTNVNQPTMGKTEDDAMTALGRDIRRGMPRSVRTRAIAFAHGFGRNQGPSSIPPSQQRPASEQVPGSSQMFYPVSPRARASC